MSVSEAKPIDGGIEGMIVPTRWEDRDDDVVVQAVLCEKMGLESMTDLD